MSVWQTFNSDLARLVGQVRQSLVQIHAQEGSIGAGTIWHPDGLIVTNAHVIMGRRGRLRSDLQVVLANGDAYKAKPLAYDQEKDLAALAINVEGLPTITPGDSKKLIPGEWVLALGHPWGILDALTAGIVIGTGKQLPEQADGRDWIALDLQLRPGHSGGPLINTDGTLVGINTMIRGPEVGFAIPVNTVKAFLKNTIQKKQSSRTPPERIVTV